MTTPQLPPQPLAFLKAITEANECLIEGFRRLAAEARAASIALSRLDHVTWYNEHRKGIEML